MWNLVPLILDLEMIGTALKFISILEERLDDVQSTVHGGPVRGAFLPRRTITSKASRRFLANVINTISHVGANAQILLAFQLFHSSSE